MYAYTKIAFKNQKQLAKINLILKLNNSKKNTFLII
jgi:hypothetical protein